MSHATYRAAALAALISALPAAAGAQGAAPTLPMEVFAGRLRYAPELTADDADVAGVRLGLDVGAYTGLRGFYWRQVSGDDPVQGYGAEAQLNLNVGNGVTPFLVGGLARLDFAEGDGSLPADRTLPLAGGGLRLDLGRLGLQGAVRAYLDEVENADGGRDLASSTMYSAGLAFRLGRRGRRPAAAAAPGPAPIRVVRGDTVYVVEQEDAVSERLITIPLPREGELYLRYGPAGESRIVTPGAAAGPAGETDAAQAERVRQQVVGDLEPLIRGILAAEQAALREAVRAEVARSGAALTPEAERRLIERVEAAVTLRVRDELARAGVRGDSLLLADTLAPAEPEPPAERFVPRLAGLRPFAGGNLDRPRQFVAGIRLDLGPFDPARPEVRLVPEATFGTGQGGSSGMLAANVAYEMAPVSLGSLPVGPYAYAGVGFLFFGESAARRAEREAVLNLGYGATLPVPNHPAEFFVEHQGIDLFDLNRVLVGVRFAR